MVGNPITSIPSYRARIIRMLPQIKQLDGVLITSGERAVADVGSAQVSSCHMYQVHVTKFVCVCLSVCPHV